MNEQMSNPVSIENLARVDSAPEKICVRDGLGNTHVGELVNSTEWTYRFSKLSWLGCSCTHVCSVDRSIGIVTVQNVEQDGQVTPLGKTYSFAGFADFFSPNGTGLTAKTSCAFSPDLDYSGNFSARTPGADAEMFRYDGGKLDR